MVALLQLFAFLLSFVLLLAGRRQVKVRRGSEVATSSSKTGSASLVQLGKGQYFPKHMFPDNVVKTDYMNVPEFLGRGHYGEAWLGTDAKTNEKVVIKLFFKNPGKGNDNDPEYLTGADIKDLDEIAIRVGADVRYECIPALLIHEPGPDGKPRTGADRVRRCLGHNFESAEPNQVLYMLLEDAGKLTLHQLHWQRVRGNNWTVALARQMIKMIFEGLVAIASIKWVHHDVDTSNMMVDFTAGARLVLQIIDFGCSVPADLEKICTFPTQGHEMTMPPEHNFGLRTCPDPKDPHKGWPPAFDREAPLSFDVYSGAIVALQLLFSVDYRYVTIAILRSPIGKDMPKTVKGNDFSTHLVMGIKALAGALVDESRAEDVAAWEQEMGNMYAEVAKKPDDQGGINVRNFPQRLTDLKTPAAAEFLMTLASLLQVEPKERGTAVDILATQWMQDTNVPPNPKP